ESRYSRDGCEIGIFVGGEQSGDDAAQCRSRAPSAAEQNRKDKRSFELTLYDPRTARAMNRSEKISPTLNAVPAESDTLYEADHITIRRTYMKKKKSIAD
ncbi:unnamed protein product, partial [Trichogramma brassicae]